MRPHQLYNLLKQSTITSDTVLEEGEDALPGPDEAGHTATAMPKQADNGHSPTRKDWKNAPGVRAVVQREDGKILLLKRPKDEEFHPDTWNLPGGAKDVGEKHRAGALRELFEETGLKAKPTGDKHHFKWPGGKGQAFLMHDHKGKLQLQKKEVVQAKWFDPGKLPNKLFPQTKTIVDGLLPKTAHELYALYKQAGLL